MIIADMASLEETSAEEHANSISMSHLDWDITLAELSCGMAQMLEGETGSYAAQIYPKALRLGLSRLAAAMLRAGSYPVHSIPDALRMLQVRVGDWNVSPSPPEHMADLILMDGEHLSEDAEECIVSSGDVAGELTQRIMLRAIEHCRARGDQDGYVKFRRFVIEHPVATQLELMDVLDKLGDDDLRALMNQAYEDVQGSQLQGGVVQTCVRCGWTLLEAVSRNRVGCASKRCRQLDGILPARYPASRPWGPGLRRVRAGIALYTTQPGQLELSLYRSLSKLSQLRVELWPRYDNYDIGITFPHGEVWAVDCKDSGRPGLLSARLAMKEFPASGQWMRAFYVFPAYRRTMTPHYGKVFQSGWRTDSGTVWWAFDDQFLKMVSRRLNEMRERA